MGFKRQPDHSYISTPDSFNQNCKCLTWNVILESIWVDKLLQMSDVKKLLDKLNRFVETGGICGAKLATNLWFDPTSEKYEIIFTDLN